MQAPSRRDMTRRAFLGRYGQVIALPFMASLLPRNLWAATSTSNVAEPTRYMTFFVSCGMYADYWTPTKTGLNYPLSSTLAPLKNFQNKMTVVSGLTNQVPGSPPLGTAGDHARGAASSTTGSLVGGKNDPVKNGISCDQVIAATMVGKTTSPSLQLGLLDVVNSDLGYPTAYESAISWSATGQNLEPIRSPLATFQQLFPNAKSKNASKAAAPTASVDKQKSVLDSVIEQVTSLQTTLGAEDKATLDQYLTSLRSVEQSLNVTAPISSSCKAPTGTFDASATADFVSQYSQWTQLMTLAFQCDYTRVISFMYANSTSHRIYANLGLTANHHSYSHYTSNVAKLGKAGNLAALQKIQAYEMQCFATLLTQLDAVKQSNGSLLDNSVILLTNELSDSQKHTHDHMPTLIAGGGGGRIKSNGQHIADKQNTQFAKFLLTSIRATGTSVTSFGTSKETENYPGILA